jgi:hypothetical protein
MGKQMTAEDYNTLSNSLKDIVMEAINTTSGGNSFQNEVETKLADEAQAGGNDGITKPPVERESPITVMQSGVDPSTETREELKQQFRVIANENRQDLKDSDEKSGYVKTTEDAKPVQQEDINTQFGQPQIDIDKISKNLETRADYEIFNGMGESDYKAFAERMRNLTNLNPQPKTKKMREAEAKAAQSHKTEPNYGKTCYSKNTCECDGKTIHYQDRAELVNWGSVLNSSSLSPEETVEMLKKMVTKSIRDGYGGFHRITTIIVRDQKLIINNVCFQPVIEKQYLNDKVFPWDLLDYLKSGSIAMLFDWYYLRNMSNLTTLDIDDVGLFTSTIDTDLGCRGRIGASTMFRLCKKLQLLSVGGESVTRENLYKKDSVPIKDTIARGHRSHNLLAGFKLNVCENTGRFQDYTFNNLTTYATNRGDKGLLRFCGGTVVRAGLTLGATVVNFGTHLVKGIKDIITDSTTPVTEEDLYN